MSRIHEALKKAEEQRASSQGGQAEAAQVVDIPASELLVPPLTQGPPLAAAPAPAAPPIPSFGASFTFDTLLSRCATVKWSPDVKTMLFFNGQEQAYGTEEFRTLRSR